MEINKETWEILKKEISLVHRETFNSTKQFAYEYVLGLMNKIEEE